MFIVYDKNMNVKEFPQGLRPLDIFISSIEKNRQTDSIEGRNGIITRGQTDARRTIELSVGLLSNDTQDYRLLRNKAYQFFSDDEFYVSEKYDKGKRYKVSVIESYLPDRLSKDVAQIQFMCSVVDLPYAESIGTTQDIDQNGIDSEDDLWGYGMGLIDEPLKYTHSTRTFSIYNAGNVSIHPFEQDLKITIENVNADNFTLKNLTNGTEFKITESVSSNQTIILDGPNITSNGLAFLRSTNKQFIELEPGWNEFKVSTDATVSFDFRFYYK